ncbi:MAG: ATP synthase F0 subunit B [Chloroflexi bacterium]|nr:ATP synthase F0 subunit B [Chloroflexota bacterium]
MDIQHLVDRMEDLIDEGRHLFGTKYTMLDEERALEIIDQMRISIPEEIESAARTIQQRDRVLAEANEEAARIVQQARQHSEDLIDDQEMVKQAKVRAEFVIEQARIEAQKITQEADEYVLVQLSELEQRFAHTLDEIRNGIQLMQYEEPVAVDVNPEAQAIQAPQNDGNAEPISFDRPAQAPMGSRL